MNDNVPVLIPGGKAFDDRGSLSFVNNFNPTLRGVQRVYIVENHEAGFVRAFHGHKREEKFVLVVSGTAIIKVMSLDTPDHVTAEGRELSNEDVLTFVLSAEKPQILWIPPGYFNGFKTMTADTRVMFFSTASMGSTKNDDIRIGYEPQLWEQDFR